MVVAGGIDSVDISADSDSVAHMVVVEHTEADTGSNTNWVGTMQTDMMVTPVQPEPTPHSSSSKCQLSFPSGAGMLCNPSLHALLTCKIYKIILSGYLQVFASINTPLHDSL